MNTTRQRTTRSQKKWLLISIDIHLFETKTQEDVLSLPLNNLQRSRLIDVFPCGGMRFRVQASANPYMHGGGSLQELMIPLIQYQGKKAGWKGYQAISKTEILLLGDNRLISNNLFSLSFHQSEPCGGKVSLWIVSAYFEDVHDYMINDEHL